MITQYTTSYSTVPAEVQTLIANKCSILDRYVLFQTGQNEYSALIYNPCTKECKEYTIARASSSGYSNYYTVKETKSEFEYSISNEYYVYSNDNVGRALDLPVNESVTSISLLIISCSLMFAIVFKGVIFKCIRALSKR